MSDIPEDIMQTATEIVDRIAKQHVWIGDCVADVAQAIFSERQRASTEEGLWRFWNEKAKTYLAERDASKALCDEMAKEIERLRVSLRQKFCPRPCNGRPDQFDVGDCVDAGECGCGSEIAAYRKEKEVGNG